jgi:type IV pilus biogenesis protein CpaD/CtpE
MTAMQVLWTTPGSIERCIMRVALAIAVLSLLNVLSGCASTQAFDAPFADYQQRTVMVAATGGDSLAANAALQTATPWPRYANDTNIPADAARMAKVVQRYESGAASDSGSGAQTPPSYGLGATNGASIGMGAGGSPPAQASPQQ